MRRRIKHPLIRRLLEREIRTGRGTEVYRLDDDGSGTPMFFDVISLRAWAEANLEVVGMPVDLARAERLITSGAIERDHLLEHTLRTNPEPILVCRGILGSDQIVDGAHRFLAFCAGATMYGHLLPHEPLFPGYVLTEKQWRQFVIPNDVAKLMRFDFG